ncbi:MAG: hypothetical protein KDB55_13695 [Mycobacterium sp.]|nr:hypothetical protein [Mycobacterium sp.]
MSQRVIQVVFSNPVPGKEDEFNQWYDNVHIPELLRVPGMLSATRYALQDAAIYHVEGGAVPEHRYMCVYELEGDVDEIMGTIRKSVLNGQVHMSDSLDVAGSRLSFWLPGKTFHA